MRLRVILFNYFFYSCMVGYLPSFNNTLLSVDINDGSLSNRRILGVEAVPRYVLCLSICFARDMWNEEVDNKQCQIISSIPYKAI